MKTEQLSFELDGGAAAKAALGLIVLQSDLTLEAEFRTLFDVEGIALYHSRIPSAAEVTPETLAQMERDLPRTTSLLPSPLDVVGYGCTSGATIIGTQKVAEIVQQSHPDAKVTNPISAVIAALHKLNARNIGLITPYIAPVSNAMRQYLEKSGINICEFASFEQVEEEIVARISPLSLFDAICQVGEHKNVDAVFASCTNLQSFSIIADAEAIIGKPVITSNQALAWHMIKLAGLSDEIFGPGKLFNG